MSHNIDPQSFEHFVDLAKKITELGQCSAERHLPPLFQTAASVPLVALFPVLFTGFILGHLDYTCH